MKKIYLTLLLVIFSCNLFCQQDNALVLDSVYGYAWNSNTKDWRNDWKVDSYWSGLVSDTVFIPDAAFLYALIEEGVDTNGDSLISYAEAEAITEIDIDGFRGPFLCGDIADVTGIEAFINLEKLIIVRSSLSTLDLSKNVALKHLSVGENDLTEINISNCTELLALWLIPEDRTKCPKSNLLPTLDISNNTKLQILWIGQMPTLYEVCVWETFSLNSVEVHIEENPNVYFTTACAKNTINIPGDYSSIQAGIDAASDGDTVLVAEGTYFENINFEGKPITVASQFILDKDSSHISRTIIDGSQSANPDTASVVTMWSGEDTTSVLMGFTITGGTGTINILSDGVKTERGGGGIFIKGSGGLISHNIIEGNHVEDKGFLDSQYGGGIYADVYNKHSVLIRKNIIRNNSTKGEKTGGGGIAAFGGRIVCEYNEIVNNSAISNGWVFGGGMMGLYLDAEEVIREVIIRNNLISGNLASQSHSGAGGGGYYQIGGFGEELTQVYNNVICNNHATYIGGGLFFWDDAQGMVFNNTIVDNTAADNGQNVVVAVNKELSLYNNIIWSFGSSNIPEFALYSTDAAKLQIFNNIIKQPFEPGDALTAFDNNFSEPVFQPGSYSLAENSPGVGWGIDSKQIDNTWYDAPSVDIYGNPRPHPIDAHVDLGAFESPYEGYVDIPDSAFLNALIRRGVDANGDNLISYSEAEALTFLYVADRNDDDDVYTDMTGIESFINLDTLICSRNHIISLDLSYNTKLRYLDCSGFREDGKLASLNVSNNIGLQYLSCGGNQLTNLDISKNIGLQHLSCGFNQLTNLDISNNPKLTHIDLFAMPTLFEVCVWTMPFPPDGVDVSMEVSPNVYFTTECGANFVTIPDIFFLHALTRRGVDTNEDGLISYVEAEAVTYLDVRDQEISDMSGIEAFVNLDSLACAHNRFRSLDVSACIALTKLSCWDNHLFSLDVSGCTALTELNCRSNYLDSLDVSDCIALTKLFCWDNRLDSLDVSNCTALTDLECSWNGLTILDISNTTALTDLNCGANKLTSLDISDCTALTFFSCGGNQSLNEICVWTMPFPPPGVTVDTTGSPLVEFKDCSSGSGIEGYSQLGLSIYPNPTNGHLNIEADRSDHYLIGITSLNGQQIYSGEMEGTTHQIDLSSFQIGVYFITIRSPDFVTSGKIIKL